MEGRETCTSLAGAALKANPHFPIKCNCGHQTPFDSGPVHCSDCDTWINVSVIEGDPGYLPGRGPIDNKDMLICVQGSSAKPVGEMTRQEYDEALHKALQAKKGWQPRN